MYWRKPMRDYQKAKVYAWEQKVANTIAHQNRTTVKFENAQTVVDGVWLAMSLLYPPNVVPIAKQERRAWAKADRTKVYLPAEIPTWVLLHELAHSMTMDIEGYGDRHGPRFVGMYMRLLEKFLGVSLLMLMASANIEGVKYDIMSEPVFQKEAA
jgi:hypothetical protein